MPSSLIPCLYDEIQYSLLLLHRGNLTVARILCGIIKNSLEGSLEFVTKGARIAQSIKVALY